MSEARAALRAAFLDGIEAEIERRRETRHAQAGDSLASLVSILDAMAERIRSGPGFVPETPAQQRRTLQQIESWFRSRG